MIDEFLIFMCTMSPIFSRTFVYLRNIKMCFLLKLTVLV